jgi:hypothetical protein
MDDHTNNVFVCFSKANKISIEIIRELPHP